MSPRKTPENRIPNIVKAAFVVFSEKGYMKTKMEEIAAEAGISKGTLYYYFVSKAHLFYYLLQNGIVETGEKIQNPEDSAGVSEWDILENIEKRLMSLNKMESTKLLIKNEKKGSIDIKGELKTIIDEIWGIIEKNGMMIILLERSHAEFPDLSNLFKTRGTERMFNLFDEYLKSRIKLNAISIWPFTSTMLISRMLIETISWFGWKGHRDGKGGVISREELVDGLASFFARGLKDEGEIGKR